jgi:hypothetical protein
MTISVERMTACWRWIAAARRTRSSTTPLRAVLKDGS